MVHAVVAPCSSHLSFSKLHRVHLRDVGVLFCVGDQSLHRTQSWSATVILVPKPGMAARTSFKGQDLAPWLREGPTSPVTYSEFTYLPTLTFLH